MEASIDLVSVPLLDLKAQYDGIRVEIDEAIKRVVNSQYFILGPEVAALEKEIATYSQVDFGVGVSSGTDALVIALMAIGIKSGDEVITTPYSFFATAGSIARLGATPVFVDIDPLTYNIDPAQVAAKITSHTKAILPVHLYGQMADMDPLMEIANQFNLYVIEDAAQAVGAEYFGRRAGSIGHMGCFSFFPSKNLGGFGDGGMVVTNDEALAERLDILRKHGSKPKYYHRFVGGNFRLDAIQAAVLRVKLRYLEQWTAARQQNAERYRKLFIEKGIAVHESEIECIQHSCDALGSQGMCDLQERNRVVLPTESQGKRHIYNQFTLRCPRRDELLAHLKASNIGCEIYYPVPLHLQECFADLEYQPGSLPHSECAANETLAIPIYPEMTSVMRQSVVETITAFYAC